MIARRSASATDETAEALQRLIFAAARGAKEAEKEAVMAMTAHLKPQFFWDLQAKGGLESDQKFEEKQCCMERIWVWFSGALYNEWKMGNPSRELVRCGARKPKEQKTAPGLIGKVVCWLAGRFVQRKGPRGGRGRRACWRGERKMVAAEDFPAMLPVLAPPPGLEPGSDV